MPRVSLTEVESIADALSAEWFSLEFGAIPALGVGAGKLRIKIIDLVIPGMSNESWQNNLHGFVQNLRGRLMFQRILPVSFAEDSNFSTTSTLRQWHNFIVDPITGKSKGYRKDYSVDALLEIMDTTGKVVNSMILKNTYIQDIQDTQMSGESSQQMRIQVSFHYDWMEDKGPFITGSGQQSTVGLVGTLA